MFRRGWLTGLLHFGVSHLAVQLSALPERYGAQLAFPFTREPVAAVR